MLSCAAHRSSSTGSWRTRVEIVTITPTPAALARARMPSRSATSCGKSRWQWWSTSITLDPSLLVFRRLVLWRLLLLFGLRRLLGGRLGLRRNIAREDALRFRQHRAGLQPAGLAQRLECV